MIALRNREQDVLNFLKENKRGITVLQCQQELGTTELRKSISMLKDKGFIIGDVWEQDYNRYGNKVKFKRYFLLGEPR